MKHRKKKHVSRRDFLKTTVAGAAAFGLAPYAFFPARAEAYSGGAKVHPNISPLRVAGIHDPNMTTDLMPRSSWAQQEQLVNTAQIHANMDRVACALSGEKSPAAAWKAIFVKPPRKNWSEVVVAMKTNNIAQQHTRSPVIAKVCHVFTDIIGVKPANIAIYDARHGGNLSSSTPFKGLPEGVRIENRWGGSNVATSVPAPWKGGTGNAKCLSHLVQNKVDILVNIALCKGHSNAFGGFTMCMKNHFGTFEPGPGHQPDGRADYLIAINKTPEILGRMDPASGNVLFPRQQLCIIDALWGSQGGPGKDSTSQMNRIYMSTFAPAIDYQVATHLRQREMGWRVNTQVAERFLKESGYRPSGLPNGGRIIDAMKAPAS